MKDMWDKMKKLGPVIVVVIALAMVVPAFAATAENEGKQVSNPGTYLPDEIARSDRVLVPTDTPAMASLVRGMELDVDESYDSFVMAKLTTEQKQFLYNNQVSLKGLPDRTKINLCYAQFDTSIGEPANIPLKINGYPENTLGTYIVQFIGPVKAEWTAQLEATGAKVYQYIPNYAYAVQMTESTRKAVESMDSVQWTGIYQPIYKVHGAVWAPSGQKDLVIRTFDPALTGAVATQLAKWGATVRYSDNTVGKILATVDLALVPYLAYIENVRYIEQELVPESYNANMVWVVQTGVSGDKAIWAKGLHGEGQIGSSSDTGIDTTHPAFAGKSFPANYHNGPGADGTDTDGHGTHTGCSVAGDDSGDSNGRGVAYSADYSFFDLSSGIIDPTTGKAKLDAFPGTYSALYDVLYADGARISSNSWGSANEGAYSDGCEEVDKYMWDHKDFVLFYSAGNREGDNYVGTPGSAKNTVSVGGCGNSGSMNNMVSFSSYGPTKDGRLKPDITAPAVITSAIPGGSYASMQGTSMSCPAAAGAALLIRQYFTEGWYPSGAKGTGITMSEPSGTLIKCMMLNGGTEMTGTGAYTHKYNSMPFPNGDQGWGRVTLKNSLYFSGDATSLFVVDDKYGLVTGESKEYEVPMSGAGDVRIFLSWSDYPGDPAASTVLVNDLDLTVTDGSSNTYKGNVFGTSTVHKSVTGGSYDTKNSVEGVRTDGNTGTWKIKVSATNIAKGPQPFALVVRGPIDSSKGKIYLDQPTYNDADTVGITVESTASSVSVKVHSTTETADETISLSEVGSSNVWTGTIDTSTTSSGGDSKVGVADGDTITATFNDGSDHIATAKVDLGVPTISGVWVNNIADTFATVNWATAKPSDSKVEYGKTSPPSLTATDATQGTAHSVKLINLEPATLYYFKLTSSTRLGKIATDDNSGTYFTFSTGLKGSILFIDGSNDTVPYLQERYKDMFVSRGWTYSVWNTKTGGAPTRDYMKDYYAVVYETGEKYPQMHVPEMQVVKDYIEGGGRFFMSSHDIGWDLGSDDSGSHRTTWTRNWFWDTMRSYWNSEDANSTGTKTFSGKSGDPITGNWASGGASYKITRKGGYMDEITQKMSNPDGTPIFDVWRSPSAESLAMHWESSGTKGSSGDGIWGGQNSRLVYYAFKMYEMDGNNMKSTIRADIMNKTLIWLLESTSPPYVSLTQPNGGETVSGVYNIKWVLSAPAPNKIDLQYSPNGGQAWYDISGGTSLPGSTSSFDWNVGGLKSGSTYRVRVVATKAVGASSMIGMDVSDNNFTVAGGYVKSGWIEGTVTDSVTSNPISGVTVSATGGGSGTTDASGHYNISVPVGTYTVTFSKTGYTTATESNVVVTENKTTTVNKALVNNIPEFQVGGMVSVVGATVVVFMVVFMLVRTRKKEE